MHDYCARCGRMRDLDPACYWCAQCIAEWTEAYQNDPARLRDPVIDG